MGQSGGVTSRQPKSLSHALLLSPRELTVIGNYGRCDKIPIHDLKRDPLLPSLERVENLAT